MKLATPKRTLWILVFGVLYFWGGTAIYGGETMLDDQTHLMDIEMSYRLEGAYSPYQYIQVNISGMGEAKLSYALYKEYTAESEAQEKTISFVISSYKVEELVSLYDVVDFFNVPVNDINKDQIRVTDVGTTTFTYRAHGKERSLSYGYIENNPLEELVRFYEQIAQEYLPDVPSDSLF